MNDNKDTVALYEEVARITGKMLSAAHQSDWDRLTELEVGCANCVERLKGCAAAEPLSSEARQKKVALLKTILNNDRQIRQITEPWMQKISALLVTANVECKLARTYFSPPE